MLKLFLQHRLAFNLSLRVPIIPLIAIGLQMVRNWKWRRVFERETIRLSISTSNMPLAGTWECVQWIQIPSSKIWHWNSIAISLTTSPMVLMTFTFVLPLRSHLRLHILSKTAPDKSTVRRLLHPLQLSPRWLIHQLQSRKDRDSWSWPLVRTPTHLPRRLHWKWRQHCRYTCSSKRHEWMSYGKRFLPQRCRVGSHPQLHGLFLWVSQT